MRNTVAATQVMMPARQAVQTAEDARLIAIQKMEETFSDQRANRVAAHARSWRSSAPGSKKTPPRDDRLRENGRPLIAARAAAERDRLAAEREALAAATRPTSTHGRRRAA